MTRTTRTTPTPRAARPASIRWYRAVSGSPADPSSVRLTPVRPFPEAILLAAHWSSRLDSTAPAMTRRAKSILLAAAPRILILPKTERPN